MLFVTHSVEEAVFLSDRVVVLTRSPGRIKQIIDIDLPRPRRRAELLVDRRYQEYVVDIEKLMDNPSEAGAREPLPASQLRKRTSERAMTRLSAIPGLPPLIACLGPARRLGARRARRSTSAACRRRTTALREAARRSSPTPKRCSTSSHSMRRMVIGFALALVVRGSGRPDDGAQRAWSRPSSIRC